MSFIIENKITPWLVSIGDELTSTVLISLFFNLCEKINGFFNDSFACLYFSFNSDILAWLILDIFICLNSSKLYP